MAREFIAANSESFTRADNAALSIGDFDFGIACFVTPDDVATTQGVFSRRSASPGSREYYLQLRSTGVFRWSVWHNSTGSPNEPESGTITANTTYWVNCEFDSTTDTASIALNNGTPVTDATNTVTPTDTGSSTNIGARGDGVPFDGSIGQALYYKGLLTAGERTFLYNSGSGRKAWEVDAHATLGPIGGAGKVVEMWDMAEYSGNALSYTGNNDLTDTNTVGRFVFEPARLTLTRTDIDNSTLLAPDGQDARDITGNGLLDILVAEALGKVFWYEQTSAGSFTKRTIRGTVRTGGPQVEGAAWVDVDGDGEYEAVVVDAGLGDLLIYVQDTPGTPTGTWTQGKLIDGTRPDLQDVKAWDIDGDGREEIVYSWEGDLNNTGGINWLDWQSGDVLVDTNYVDNVMIQHDGAWWIAPVRTSFGGGSGDTIVFAARNKGNPAPEPGVFYLVKPTPVTNAWSETTIESHASDDFKHVDVGDFFGNGNQDVIVHVRLNATTDDEVRLYDAGDSFAKTTVVVDARSNAFGLRRYINGREAWVTCDEDSLETVVWAWSDTGWQPYAVTASNKQQDRQMIFDVDGDAVLDFVLGDSNGDDLAYFELSNEIDDVIVFPDAAAGVGTASDPSIPSAVVTPAAAASVGTGTDPSATSDIVVTGLSAAGVAAVTAPAVNFGSVSIVPAAATSVSAITSPSALLGSTVAAPAAASGVGTVTEPTVTLGSPPVTPQAAAGVGALGLPTVVISGVSVTPTAASAVCGAIAPTVLLGGAVVSAVTASAVAAITDPGIDTAEPPTTPGVEYSAVKRRFHYTTVR